MKSKNALVTISIGSNYNDLAAITLPRMRAYAEKIGVEFHIIDTPPNIPHIKQYCAYWAKISLGELLKRYDRIIYVDLDVLITPIAPNLLDIVSKDKFGALFETDFDISFDEEMSVVQTKNGCVDWDRNYFNVGVMVISQEHRELFQIESGEIGGERYPEQTYLNYKLAKLKLDTEHLSYKFNHMFFLRQDNQNRHNSYFIHYAGIPHQARVILAKVDSQRIDKGLSAVSKREMAKVLLDGIKSIDRETIFKYTLVKDEKLGI